MCTHPELGLGPRRRNRIAEELDEGELVFIFPEGAITRDGELQPFRPGIDRIIRRTPVPVVPMAVITICPPLGSAT